MGHPGSKLNSRFTGEIQKSKAVKFPPFRKEREMVGQPRSKPKARFTSYTFQTRVARPGRCVNSKPLKKFENHKIYVIVISCNYDC
jgi:hypothetical protein